MADLTVKVEGNVNTNIDKMAKTVESGHKQKNITDINAGKAMEDLKRLRALAQKGVLSESELKEFDSAFKRVSKILDEATRKSVKMTAEAEKALKQLRETEGKLSEKTKLRLDNRTKRTQAITDYATTAKKYKEEDKISIGGKRGITRLETLAQKDINSLPIYRDGQVLTGDTKEDKTLLDEIRAKLKLYVDTLNETNKAEKELTNSINHLTEKRLKEENTYEAINSADKAAGRGVNLEFAEEVRESTAAMYGSVTSMKEDISKEKEQNAILQSDVQLSGLNDTVNKSQSALGKLTKQVGLFAIGLRLAKRAISEVRSTITELDKSLTEQAMVTGKTRKEVYGLLSSYQQLAIQTGSTTKEISATVTEFVRQGKSFQEAMTLAEAATSAAKVAGISSADSVNYLTTALNGFRLSAEQAMSVSDKFAAISASAATSYEEIAIALSKVASQANLAGMSIDYTTALLAKGLETTREAPETIGTALKTIIARMREITDYGETLEDGVDINNVESQLSYVGVALRSVSGELRSTEDVLNDLGGKWDTLSANQQAAVAKALAGTRQQSRLIAMMSDYERVIELQEIAAQSSGATLAQMAVYGEGLEAALNRLSTQWEKIISTLSSSDVIVGLVDFASFMLDRINAILESSAGIYALGVVIGVAASAMLLSKIEEYKVQKMLLREQLELRKSNLENLKVQKEALIKKKEELIAASKDKVLKQEALVIDLRAQAAKADETKKAEYAAQLKVEEAKLQQMQTEELTVQKGLESEIIQLKTDINTVDTEIALTENQMTLNSVSLLGTLNKILPVVGSVLTILTMVNSAKKKGIALTEAQTAADKKNADVNIASAPAKIMGGSASGGLVGLAIGAAILAALGLGIALTIQFNQQQQNSDKILQKTGAEIFNITKNVNALQSTFDALDKIDKKLIKSKEDAKAYADELTKIETILSSDKNSNLLNDVGNMSEQEYYKSLTSDSDRIAFLNRWKDEANKRLDSLRQQQRESLTRTGIRTSTEKITATSLIRSDIYNEINNLELSAAEKSSMREFVDSIVDEFSDDQKRAILNNGKPLSDIMSKALNTKINGEGAVGILSDEARTIQERAKAYKSLQASLIGIAGASEWMKGAYAGWDKITEMFSDEQLKNLDKFNIDFNKLNNLYTNFDTVAKKVASDTNGNVVFSTLINEEDYQKGMLEAVKNLDRFEGDVSKAVRTAFEGIIGTSEEYNDVWNAIFDQFGNALTVGIQNIGQSVDKLKSSVTSFYSTAQKWNTMSKTEQSTFMSEHAAEFSGEDGAKLLEAFETQDYNRIEEALRNNQTIRNNLDRQIQQVRQELGVEEAKLGATRDEGKIKMLKEVLAQLEADTFYQVDLETLVEQQNARINAYKELLQKEEELLTKSLEERKDAYQSYFDSINQKSEDENYEEKAGLLTANLAKLSGSTSMTAKAQTEELQNSLAELEKERLDTLRQRAQEAVIQSIDDTITEINDSFAELLENNREILNLLKGTSGESLVADLLSQDSFSTKTAAEAQQYLNEIQSTFGSQVSGIDWSKVSISETGGQLTLNIGDQVIQLSGKEAQGRNIKEAILTALAQNGINGGSI
ncbi:MAG: phage tail tape measure protein [Methanobrevibacter sp.]|nr:phage tail tape measure protein [Methanobrevibacter sp.]